MDSPNEVNPAHVKSGALAVLGFVGIICGLIACWAVLYFYFNPQKLPNPTSTPVAEIEPTAAPTNTLVAGPINLPPGPLRLERSSFSLLPGCSGRIEFQLSKGGQPLPANALIQFAIRINGAPVPFSVNSSGGGFQFDFTNNALCSSGTAGATAQIAGALASKLFFYDASSKTTADKLSVTNVQVDSDRNPELTTYFGLAKSDGSPARLGIASVLVMQDGAEVTDFSMMPVDPNANPLTVALLLDVSGSMRGAPLTNARQAASDFMTALGANDSGCIYSFSTTVTQVQKCTTDRKAAIASLVNLVASGNTALYDVLATVAADHAKLSGRQAIIVLTDGADTASKTTMADALARLKQTNLPVYTIGLVSKDFKGDVLRQLALSNGGSYYEAPAAGDLKRLYSQIQSQLKNQYRISFRSLSPEKKSGTISIRLEVGDQIIEFSRTFVVK